MTASDELYSVWVKMKKLSLDDPSLTDDDSSSPFSAPTPLQSNPSPPMADIGSTENRSVLDDILVYLTVPESKKSGTNTRNTPMHEPAATIRRWRQ